MRNSEVRYAGPMLSIRQSQMKMLEQSVYQAFEDKLAIHLDAFLAAKGLKHGPDEIRDQIRRGMKYLDDFGLEFQCDIARYFEIVLGSGGRFADEPLPLPKDALNILYGYRVDPELKLNRLEAWASTQGT